MIVSDELLDALALRLVAERYASAVDGGDGEMFAAQFTADGILEAPRGRFVGRAQLAGVPAMMRRLYARTHHGIVGMAPVFEREAARAETRCYARHYFRDDAGVEQCYEMTVRYDDVFARREGAWLLSRRVLTLIGDATFPTGRRGAPVNPSNMEVAR